MTSDTTAAKTAPACGCHRPAETAASSMPVAAHTGSGPCCGTAQAAADAGACCAPAAKAEAVVAGASCC